MKFWTTNRFSPTIDGDTLNKTFDRIVILKANPGTEEPVLLQNYEFNVISQEIIMSGDNKGDESINDLIIVPTDEDNDGLPDNITLPYIIDPDQNFVYFTRETINDEWTFVPFSQETLDMFNNDEHGLWKREIGREGINFLWLHSTPRYHLIDPSATNIVDMFVITRGYYSNIRNWLSGATLTKPSAPTTFDLKNSYNYLLQNKMISDTVILQSGKIKVIIGSHASDELKATIKVVRSKNRALTNNQVKTLIVDYINTFFDINVWEFGETFYFTELSTYLHSKLVNEVDSIVLVPKMNNSVFGELFQVYAKENEIIQPSISVNDIDIIESLSPSLIKAYN
jgi:hypothetical protein